MAKKRNLVKDLDQAYKDWNSGVAYIDNVGNYRMKKDGSASGKIAPWNKAVKEAFPDSLDFHNAAQIAKEAKPEPIPTPTKKPRKIKVVSQHEEDAMAAFNLWEEEPTPEKPKPEPVRVETPPEPVTAHVETEAPPIITTEDLKNAKWVGGKLVLEEPKPVEATTVQAASQPNIQIVQPPKPPKKVKISQQKSALGQLHRTMFHPQSAGKRKMRVWENVFYNPVAKKSRRKHPRKRVLKSQW
jgi:hypothetical protein